LAVRATRVRRLRIRKAIQRSTLAAVALTVSISLLQLQTAAGERQTVTGASSVLVREASSPDVGVWVVEGTSSIRPQAGLALAEAFASTPGVGMSSVVVARVVVTGKVHDVLTNATTAGELLSAMGITPDADDRVLPSIQAPLHSGHIIRFDRVRIVTREARKSIPPTIRTVYVNDLSPGQVRWLSPGIAGLMLETYRIRFVNGKVVRKVLIHRLVAREAVPGERQMGSSDGTAAGIQVGEASWYDAPGTGYTAAHPWLPFGTHVTVTNLATGESVVVVIDDRGPFGGRIIDLSPEAFGALAPLGAGVMQVRLTW
jgi:hypothetical protein